MARQLAGQAYGTQCNTFDASSDALGGCPEHRPAPNTSLALDRLRDGFAFVGLTDAYALSICLFHAMHGGECSETEFVNANPTGEVRHAFASTEDLYNQSSSFEDPDDLAVFHAARNQFCGDLARYDVTHASCRERLCPAAAANLTASPPDEARPGEAASLCDGRETSVLRYRPP